MLMMLVSGGGCFHKWQQQGSWRQPKSNAQRASCCFYTGGWVHVYIAALLRRYPRAFAKQVAQLMPKLLLDRKGVDVKSSVPQGKSALELFQALPFSDLVEDGELIQVARYLRGSTRLRVPPAWRAVLPAEL